MKIKKITFSKLLLVVSLLSTLLTQAQTWETVGNAGFSLSSANYQSLAIDNNNVPYVAFQDGSNSYYKTTVMKFDGANWVTVGSAGFSLGGAFYQSLAIDNNNVPYVAYRDGANSYGTTVMKFDGANWVTVGNAGFSGSNAYYQSLAIDNNNVPYVAFQDGSNSYGTTVMKFDGANWVTVGNAGFSYDNAEYQSLAIDNNNVPYVAYRHNGSTLGKTTVMKFDGNNWVTVGSIGFSAGQSDYQSLAIDSNNVPYVAYQDAGNSSKTTVMKFDGTNWVTVGGAGFSGSNAYYQSLAIDNNNVPYVAYHDGSNSYGTTVMKFDGSNWVTVGNVGFSGSSANYQSLAIDDDNVAYVAYNDNLNAGKTTVKKFNTTDTTSPVITLTGVNPQVIEVGSAYTELGATANDNVDGDISNNIVINATSVNTAVLGSYTVTYNVSDAATNAATVVTRTVNVVDTTSPVITLTGDNPQVIEVGNAYTELGATANDNLDGDISNDVVINATSVNTAVVGSYTVTYNVSDAATNAATEVTRTVNVVDTTPPVISGISMTSNNANTSYAKVGDVITMVFTSNETINTPTVTIAGQLATVTNNGNSWSATITVNRSSNQGSAYFTITNISDLAANTANNIQGTPATTLIIDVTAPVAIVTSNVIVININNNPTLTVQDINDGSNDNISLQNLTVSVDKTAFTCDDIVLGQVSTQYLVTLTVTDESGNTSIATKTISLVDDVAPQNVQLVNPDYVHQTGTAYVEQGLTYDEACFSEVVIVSSDLDVNQWGTYTIVYKVVDKSGNESAEITRTQIVNNVPTTDVANFTVNQDTTDNIFDVLAGDSFGPDGAKSFVTSGVNTIQGGTLILNDNGTESPTDDTLVYSPRATYNGPDSFTYTIEDENGDTALRNVNITVRPIVPVPVNDAVSVSANSTNNIINVLANDDFGGNGANATHPLTFKNGALTNASIEGGLISVGDNGTANDLSDDVILYSAPAGFVGTDSFQYVITDADGDASTATVTITVSGGVISSNTPTAVNDAASVNEGSTDNSIDVLANDNFGVDGAIDGGLTMTNGTLTSASLEGGAISIDNKGTLNTMDDVFKYTAPAGFTGTDSFQYTITDASGDASTATVTVTVGAVSNAPSAVADSSTANQDSTSNTINVLANDSFGTDGAGTLTLASAVTTAGGSVLVNDGGTQLDATDDTISYTPLAGYVGQDTFEYTLTDSNGDTDTATVTITVSAVASVNGTPTAVNDAVSVNAGSSDTIITILVNDDYGTDGPNATHPLTMTNGALINASIEGGSIRIVDNPNNPTPLILSDDIILYTPPVGFSGTDSFQYVITDASGDASRATVTITVSGGVITSSTPTAVNDAASVNAGSADNSIDVLANDNFGVDGAIDGGLTMTNGTLISASLNGGAISIDNKGTLNTMDDVFKYTAPAGFTGTDSFQYTITDASGDASTATVTVTVSVVADAPSAVADSSLTVSQNSTSNSINVLANDSFGTDGAGTLTLASAVTTAGGSVTVNDGGTPLDATDDTISYTPLAGYVGQDTFEYTLTDSNGDTDTATVTITVEPVTIVNGLPTAVNDNLNIVRAPNQIVVIDVIANDNFGTDGFNLTHPLTLINGKSTEVSLEGRTITIDNNGTPLDLTDDKIKYYATDDVNVNSDSFTYTITDASGDASTGTVFITYSSLKSSDTTDASELTLTDNNDLVAFPNPSNGRVSLVLESSVVEASNLMIIDILGKVVFTKKVDLTRGKNQLDFDLNLSPGTFFLQLTTPTKRYKTTKLIFN